MNLNIFFTGVKFDILNLHSLLIRLTILDLSDRLESF